MTSSRIQYSEEKKSGSFPFPFVCLETQASPSSSWVKLICTGTRATARPRPTSTITKCTSRRRSPAGAKVSDLRPCGAPSVRRASRQLPCSESKASTEDDIYERSIQGFFVHSLATGTDLLTDGVGHGPSWSWTELVTDRVSRDRVPVGRKSAGDYTAAKYL